jgi:hypothetical protein
MYLFYGLLSMCFIYEVIKIYTINACFKAIIELIIWTVYQLSVFVIFFLIVGFSLDKSKLENKQRELERINGIGAMYLSNRERRLKSRLEIEI